MSAAATLFGVAVGALRGAYGTIVPKSAYKSRAAFKEWKSEERMETIQEAIIAALGAGILQGTGLCEWGYFPGLCQFGYGYAGVSAVRAFLV